MKYDKKGIETVSYSVASFRYKLCYDFIVAGKVYHYVALIPDNLKFAEEVERGVYKRRAFNLVVTTL